MKQPSISIVIPLFNKEKYITKCIQSVLNQSIADFELLIIDDGSTDNSIEKINQFKDVRIRIIHQPNSGVSAARNKGIHNAKAHWVALLDADDLWHKDHLKTLLSLTQTYPHHEFFSTRLTLNPKSIGKRVSEDQEITNYPEYVLKHNWGAHSSSVMASKNLWQKVGGFPEGENLGEDIVTWLKLSQISNLVLSGISDIFYTTGDANSLVNKGNNPNVNIIKDDALVKYIEEIEKNQKLSQEKLKSLVELKNKMLLARVFALISKGKNKEASPFLARSQKTILFKKHWLICRIAVSLPSFISILLTKVYIHKKISNQ